MSLIRKSSMRKSVLLIAVLAVLAALPFAQQAKKPKVLQSTNPELRLKGFEEYKAMQAASKFKDLKWQFLGPTNVSGRVTDVAVVAPKGKNYTIYVATASGGVWKTENEGTTWAPIFENYVSAAVGDIALAPSNPQIIWAGTGEHNIFRSSQAGYAPSTASIMAKRLTDKLECNRYFMEEAHRQGLTVEAIIGELKRGVTEAMHPLRPDQPDNYNRRGYMDLAMKLFGAYAPTKVDLDIQKKEATIVITPEVIERLERYDRQLAQLEAMGHIVPDPPKDKTPFG